MCFADFGMSEECVFASVGSQSSAWFSFLPLFLTLPNLVISLPLTFDSMKKVAELLSSHFLILLQNDFSKPESSLSFTCQSAFVRGTSGSEMQELFPDCGHWSLPLLLSTASSLVRPFPLDLLS